MQSAFLVQSCICAWCRTVRELLHLGGASPGGQFRLAVVIGSLEQGGRPICAKKKQQEGTRTWIVVIVGGLDDVALALQEIV